MLKKYWWKAVRITTDRKGKTCLIYKGTEHKGLLLTGNYVYCAVSASKTLLDYKRVI